METDYKGLNINQLRFLMRKKLIHKNFDESVLDEVQIHERTYEQIPIDEPVVDSQG